MTSDIYDSLQNGVVLIFDAFNGRPQDGSGVIIGPHTILTASHVLWNATTQSVATNIQILPGATNQSASSLLGDIQVNVNQIDDTNDLITKAASQSDYAIIETSALLTPYTEFSVSPDFVPISVVGIAGYPATQLNNQRDVDGQVALDDNFSVYDYISDNLTDPTTGIAAGMSGGPVFVNTENGPAVIGIISTFHYAAQLTVQAWNQILDWISADANPPVIAGAAAGQKTFDSGPVTPFSTVIISDPLQEEIETVTVSLSAAGNGTLSNLQGGSYNAGSGIYVVTGSPSVVTRALDDLVFTPTAGQVPVGHSVTTAFTISVTNTAGGNARDPNATVIATAAAAPCFCGGTRIRTRHGEVPVEAIKTGMPIRTHFGGITPVKWIGFRHVSCHRHLRPRLVWPVRIAAGTFGRGRPWRELYLSPDHAVFVDGALVPIKCLINGTNIEQVKADEVTYYHIELARHDVIYAEGLKVESYLDVGDRTGFTNSDNCLRVRSEAPSCSQNVCGIWEANGCAPIVVAGPRLEAVRRDLDHIASHGARVTAA